jgi:hypothetical protein
MSRIVKIIITGLTITLLILSSFTYSIYKNKSLHSNQATLNNQTKQEQTFRVIGKETVVNKLNLENKLECLSGNVQVQAKYTNNTISDEDVNFKWLKSILKDSTSKDLTVNSSYKFLFSYNLMDLPIQIHNSTINIQLSYNRLSLESIELLNTDSKERVGILESQFTPSEVNSINERVKLEARNTIQSKDEYKQQAMKNIQEDIKTLLQSVISKETNIHFDIIESSNTVEQNDVQLMK